MAAPTLESLAALIAGEAAAPAGLVPVLDEATEAIRWEARRSVVDETTKAIRWERRPVVPHTILRRRLMKLRRQAREMAAALDEKPIADALDNAATELGETFPAIWHGPVAMEKLADWAASATSVGRGRRRAPGVEASLPEVCATFVVLVWEEVGSPFPGHASEAANEACNALYKLSGQRLQDNSNKNQRWDDYLKDARAAALAQANPSMLAEKCRLVLHHKRKIIGRNSTTPVEKKPVSL
jgi:hypothetical protein